MVVTSIEPIVDRINTGVSFGLLQQNTIGMNNLMIHPSLFRFIKAFAKTSNMIRTKRFYDVELKFESSVKILSLNSLSRVDFLKSSSTLNKTSRL